MLWGLVIKFLTSTLPGLATAVLDFQVKKMNVDLEGFKTGTTVDGENYKAFLAAQVETNRLKLAQQSWWGARAIILTAGMPAAAHFGAVMMDSLPFPIIEFGSWYIPHLAAHAVGSWHIPKLPAPYDGYQWSIVSSFFILLPAMPLANAASQWLTRRR